MGTAMGSKRSANGTDKLRKITSHERGYKISCGKVNGKPKVWWLGADHDVAEDRAMGIRLEWRQIKLAGDDEWTPDALIQAEAIRQGGYAPQSDDTDGPDQQPATAATFHSALDAYRDHILKSSKQHAWKNYIAQCLERLKRSYPDVSINSLNYDSIHSIGEYWLSLPKRKGSDQPIAPETALSHIKISRMFFNWLDATDAPEFDAWRLPRRYSTDLLKYRRADLDRRYRNKTGVSRSRRSANRVFTLDEMGALFSHATRRERLYMLLALNCGMTQNELSTLRLDEIKDLDGDVPHIERERTKTGILGKWLLWDVTVKALQEWYIIRADALAARDEREKPFHNSKPDQIWKARSLEMGMRIDGETALCGERLCKLIHQTKTGNRVDTVAATWYRLLGRVKKNGIDIPLPNGFKTFRKTGAQLILNVAGAEAARIYLSHGDISSDDLLEDYVNRNFDSVFAALAEVRKKLASVLPTLDQFQIPAMPISGAKNGNCFPPIRRSR